LIPTATKKIHSIGEENLHSHVINIKGRSWRLKEMEEAIQFAVDPGKDSHTKPSEAIFSSEERFSS